MNSDDLRRLRACCRDQVAFEQMQEIIATAHLATAHLLTPTDEHLQNKKLLSLGQLVADVAHEINNPVNFICGNLNHANQYAQQLIELLSRYQQECPTSSPELQQYMEEVDFNFIMQDFPKLLSSMQMGSDRVRQLVLSLRNFSRTDAVEMQPTNLHDGLDSTLLILQHRLKPKSNTRGIHVICEYGDLPPVECYSNQINQVFMNLISNAIDALEEKHQSTASCLATNTSTHSAQAISDTAVSDRPQITIRTMHIPDPQGGVPRAIICIADNGPGIPLSNQEKLFMPFYTTKPLGKGTGIGLSLSYDIIVNKHGGELHCYSQPGEGAEFWIELPVKQVRAEEPSIAHSTLETTPMPSNNALLYQA